MSSLDDPSNFMTGQEERLDASRRELARRWRDAHWHRVEPRYRRHHARLETPIDRATNNEGLPWTNELRILFCGSRQRDSPLSLLRGHEDTILRYIYDMVVQTYMAGVQKTHRAQSVGRIRDTVGDVIFAQSPPDDIEKFVWRPQHNTAVPVVHILMEDPGYRIVPDRPEIAFSRCGTVNFPEPADRNVNMLPFIMGDKESLLDSLQPYYDTVISKCPVDEAEIGKVVYLTVNEGFVQAAGTQRRGGLHIESPGSFIGTPSFTAAWEHHWGQVSDCFVIECQSVACFLRAIHLFWFRSICFFFQGVAFSPDELRGGIFFASNVDNTSEGTHHASQHL